MNPKLFISYSWTDAEHQAWILEFATDLVSSGIDVILDKWDIKEGHDAYKFMESMVSNPEIKKVILVCNKDYATKSDSRIGGVGTETQIITPILYGKHDQSKFVAVIRERNTEGIPFLPTYYLSRKYIDLADPDTYAEKFEQLLRWAYDKPLHIKPDLGKPPAFLADDNAAVRLNTSVKFFRAVDAIKFGRSYAVPAIEDYLTEFVKELEKFRIDSKKSSMEDTIIDNLDAFTAYRNEIIDLISTISRYLDNPETRKLVHRFFESLIPYTRRPTSVNSWLETDFDNFKFIANELFRYAIAIYLRSEKFDAASFLLSEGYFIGNNQDVQESMASFVIFNTHLKSIDILNSKASSKKFSLQAAILKDRCKGLDLNFLYVMQADFVLFLRNCLDQSRNDGLGSRWYPDTLIYLGHSRRAFEIFARAQSSSYFDKIRSLFEIEKKSDLAALMQYFAQNPTSIPHWDFQSFDPQLLIGYDQLATKP